MNSGGFQNKGGLGLGLWNNNSNNSLNNLFGNQTSSQNNGFNSNLQGNGFNSLLHAPSQNQGSLYQGSMNNSFSNSNWNSNMQENSMRQLNSDSKVADLFGGNSETNSSSNNAFLQGTTSVERVKRKHENERHFLRLLMHYFLILCE